MEKVDAEETTEPVDSDNDSNRPLGTPSGAAGTRLGAVFGQAPRGLHGCAAISAPPRSPSASPPRRRSASPETGRGRVKGRGGNVRSPPTPSGPPRAYGSPEEGGPQRGRKKRGTVRASRSPAMRASGWGEEGGGRTLRRFRTKVSELCAAFAGGGRGLRRLELGEGTVWEGKGDVPLCVERQLPTLCMNLIRATCAGSMLRVLMPPRRCVALRHVSIPWKLRPLRFGDAIFFHFRCFWSEGVLVPTCSESGCGISGTAVALHEAGGNRSRG